jgi:hypothetical protein
VAIYDLYVGAAAIALVAGIIDFRDRLKSFLLFLCSASAVLLFVASGIKNLNSLVLAATVSCFILSCGAIYVASNLIREIGATLNFQTGPRIARQTAILWLPLLAFLALATYFTKLTHEWIAGKLYSIESTAWHCREPDLMLCEDSAGSLKNSLHLTNSKFFFDANSAVRKHVESLRIVPLSTKPAFTKGVDDALFGENAVIPSADRFLPRMSGCTLGEWLWPPRIPHCIKAIILNPIHDAYETFRANLQGELDASIAAEFDQSQTMANALANIVYLNLDRQLLRVRESLDSNIDRAFFIRDAVSLFSFIAAVLLALKILLYILARLAFDENYAKKGCLLSHRTAAPSPISATQILPTVNATGLRVIGLQVRDQVWYVTTSAKGAQPAFNGRFCWPHKSEAFIRRLIHNKLFFNRYDEETSGTIPIHTEISNAFCSIELKEGDCLAISMKSLFAFTDNVTFHLAIRIRAAILLQRRFLFATATGPGTVVLVARGGALAILPNPSDNYSNIDDVIGFDMNGSVYTKVQHGFIDTYFRSFSIKPEVDTLMIREAPLDPHWSLTGLLRRFAALVLPF